MRIFVYGITGQLHVSANSQDDADAIASGYNAEVKLVVDDALEANSDILGCAIHVADKPKAVVTAGRKAIKKLASQRDWVDDLAAKREAEAKDDDVSEANGHANGSTKRSRTRKPKTEPIGEQTSV